MTYEFPERNNLKKWVRNMRKRFLVGTLYFDLLNGILLKKNYPIIRGVV